MKAQWPVAIVVLMVLLLGSHALAWAAKSKPASPLRLSVLPQKSPARPAPQADVYDAGALDILDSVEIEHTFQVRNNGKSPLVIDDLTSSCGCTTALIVAKGLSKALPVRLMPGQTAGIKVHVNVAGEIMGTLDKYVWVHVAGLDDPAATLEIKALFPPLVVLLPDTLDFGHLGAGETKQMTIYATVSPDLKPTETLVTLTTKVPFIEIGPPTAGGIAPAPAGIKGDWRRIEFTVSVDKSAPIGSYAADLNVHVTHFGPMGQMNDQVLESTYAVVRGSIAGDISAAPNSLVFGSVKLGQGASLSLTIKAVSADVLAGVSVTSGSPWVTIAPSMDEPNAAGYKVTISPSAPEGILEAKITFTTKSGQTLVVPLLAYITADVRP